MTTADTTQVYVQRQSSVPLELLEIPLPSPDAHQVSVKIIATGLCQSQVYWMHREANHPQLHGHEGFGRITAVGDEVTDLAVGDPVILTWIPRTAADGRPVIPSSVEDQGWTGASHNVHTWATDVVVDELYAVRVPEAAAVPEVAIIGCAVPTGAGAVRTTAAMKPGSSVAVIGLGGVGLAAVAAARIEGAEVVVGVDISDDKLDFSRSFGATELVNTTTGGLRDAATRFTSLHGAPGFDVVIDCVGMPATVADALASVAAGGIGSHRGGSVALVGAPKEPLTIDGADMLMAEKSLLGCRGGGAPQEDFDVFVQWMIDGRLPLDTMVTDRYGFDALPAAVEDLAAGRIRGRALVMME